MFRFGRSWFRSYLSAMLLLLWGVSSAQFKWPGGVTVTDTRQSNRPYPPAARQSQRPDPSQVCPAMVAWIQVLQNEYPGTDLGHIVSSKLQQMAIPLFSDSVFRRQFGVPYLSLSDADRREFFRTHVPPCPSRQYPSLIVLQVFGPAFQPAGAGPLSPVQLIPALTKLTVSQGVLQADGNALQSMPSSASLYDQASGLLIKRKEDLARVWPSERTRFVDIVKAAVARSANAAIQAKIQPLLSAPASPDAARQLHDAPRTYANLFQSLPADQQASLQTRMDDRRNAILRELLPPQKTRAQSFSATRQGLDDGAEWYAGYGPVFLQPPVIPEAAALARDYIARREAVLSRMAPDLRKKIDASQDADAVAGMGDDVFRLPEDRQSDTYHQLAAARSARADLLNQRAEQARAAEEAKAEKAALLRGDLVPSSLKIDGLNNGKVYRALFVGDFAHAGIGRADVLFVDMFGMYLTNFGQSCKGNLPPDKVEMTVNECVRQQHWVNGYGAQTSPDQCIEWERRPIGIWADPRAFAAKVSLEDPAQRNTMRSWIDILKTPDPVSTTTNQVGGMINTELAFKQDVPKLIAANGCGSKALQRFQENLTHFANNDDPVHAAGFSGQGSSRMTRAQDLDARALADALIRANAAGWLMNRYGGLDQVTVDSNLDAQGRPRRINATYDLEKGGLGQSGSVEITFVDGVPSCLNFADDPGNCKAPSPSIVSRYEDGAFRRKDR